jgi:hypothetical protein
MPLERNFLKYYRVIKRFTKVKYGLGEMKLDMLLFLYDEGPFNKTNFSQYANLMSFDREMFEDLLRDGWIRVYREKGKGRRNILYVLTHRSNTMVESMYNYMNGAEIPTNVNDAPIFKRNVKYSDKVYRNMILKMNKASLAYIRQGNVRKPISYTETLIMDEY